MTPPAEHCLCRSCQHNRGRLWRQWTAWEWVKVVVDVAWTLFVFGFSAYVIVMIVR